ncbi:MAG: hypothetical protein ACJ76B_06065 [Solirubrobacterales bacterium]
MRDRRSNSRRRRIQPLVWGALALALLLSACGSDSGTDSDEITIPSDAPPGKVAGLAGLDGVHSGVAEVNLLVNKLEEEEVISIRVSGGFERLGEGSAPQLLFLEASSNGEWNGRSVDSSASLNVHPEKAQITYGKAAGGESYETEAATINALMSKFAQAHLSGGRGDLGACLQAAHGFDFAQLLRDPEIEDRREEPDQTKVTVVGGDLVISRLRELLVELDRDPACGAQLAALGLPPAAALEAAKVDFKKGFGGPRLTLAVDRHGVIRKLSTHFECARLNGKVFELTLDFGMREVNRAVEVSAGSGGKPLDSLLRKLGTTEEAALEAQGAEAVTALLEGLAATLTGRPQ